MLHIKNLCLSYNNKVLFDNLTLLIQKDDRIGLVGANGAGKSTLLKLLAQQQEHPSITTIGSAKIGYMPQDITLASVLPVSDELLVGLACQEEDKERLRAEGHLILAGLGFSKEQLTAPVNTLSVGWRMRLILGKLLLHKPDFYLFDEPTNHLDIVAKEWFVSFLRQHKSGFILVSHERYFLDTLCTSIIELEHGKAERFEGNYTQYQEYKEEKLERLRSAYEQQQRDIAKKQAIIDKFRASASRASAAKSMQKALDKIERIKLPPQHKALHLEFPPIPACGRHIVKVKKLSFTYHDKPILKNISFEVERGQKIGIVAANGVGKSTLLNILTGKRIAQSGSVLWAPDTSYAYFEQDQASALNVLLSVEECAYQKAPQNVSSTTIRSLLGSFLFSQDEVTKKVGMLSGGEKNRLALSIVLMHNANVIILDEPTNHLDIISKEILLSALQAYQGTIIFVSHDQDFVNRLATDILDLSTDNAVLYNGNYDAYIMQKKAHLDAVGTSRTSTTARVETPKKSTPKAESSQLPAIEKLIHKTERDIKKLSSELELLSYESSEFQKKAERLQKLHDELAALMQEWETLML